jgi:hypothetical protein
VFKAVEKEQKMQIYQKAIAARLHSRWLDKTAMERMKAQRTRYESKCAMINDPDMNQSMLCSTTMIKYHSVLSGLVGI